MSTWDDIKALALDEELPPPIVAAEPMQIAFLEGLYAQKESLEIIFHGGTSIRLLHGGYRYSEDLDFAISVSSKVLQSLDVVVEKAYQHATSLITLHIGQAQTELKKREGRKKIPTWWFNVLPPGGRQKYRVKIEFGMYPSYLTQSVPLKVKNRFLPRQPVLVSVEAKELLVDKINALADRPYTKERDFFDVWYLIKVLDTPLDSKLLRAKLSDYHVEAPKDVLKRRLSELKADDIAENMARFLPAQYRRLLSDYKEVVDVCQDLMTRVLKEL